MRLSDTLKLLAAGYKKSDIEEMERREAEEVKEEKIEVKTEEPAPEPDNDYKALYEEATAKLLSTENDLKLARDENINRSVELQSKDDLIEKVKCLFR